VLFTTSEVGCGWYEAYDVVMDVDAQGGATITIWVSSGPCSYCYINAAT